MELQRVSRPEGPQDWEAQRAVITDLYITKGLELENLMKTMEEKHFFKATKKQYKTYFTKWDLRKNVRPSEYSAMIQKRRKREEEGKGSAFRLRGALVDDPKIVRYEKKSKRGNEHEIAEARTPKDLSCFTPSRIVGSPNAPSPVLPQFQSPNLLRSSIVSPSEHTLRVPVSLLYVPEAPDHGVHWAFSELITSLECMASLDRGSLKLDIRSRNSEIVYDTIEATTCQRMERSETNISHYRMLHSSLDIHLSGFIGCARKRIAFSRLVLALVLLREARDFSNFRCVILVKPASTDSAIKKFPASLRIDHITTSSDVRGGANRLEISVTASGCQIVVNFPDITTKDLEQMHNSRVRRSESCESIRSMESFLSDPVVDWKELLYGYNR